MISDDEPKTRRTGFHKRRFMEIPFERTGRVIQTKKRKPRLKPLITLVGLRVPSYTRSMYTYTGRVAIITGGASGIGRALGEELARCGAVVILSDLNGDLATQVAGAITAGGGRAEGVLLDVTDAEAFRNLVIDTISRFGRLDYLFNNAGVTVGGEALDLDDAMWNRVLGTDLIGVVNGVRAAYPLMVVQGFGHIVNTSSLSGLAPSPFQVPYITSKFGVVGLSLALRAEARDLGVKVSVVCPGVIDTPILKTTPIVGLDRERIFGLFPKGMAPSTCARKILRGIEKNRAIVVVTGLARIMWLLYRVSPALIEYIGVLVMRRIRAMRRMSIKSPPKD